MSASNAAVVMGGYVNGYGIVKSLHEAGVSTIYVLDTEPHPIASGSRYISQFIHIREASDAAWMSSLQKLSKSHKLLVPYPTNDWHVEFLARNADDLLPSITVPVNAANAVRAQGKSWQYARAVETGISVPQSRVVRSGQAESLESLTSGLRRPIIIKPSHRVSGDGQSAVSAPFRNVVLEAGEPVPGEIISAIQEWDVIASEVIPGPDENIFAYTAYRAKNGEILGEWVGRKVTQHPQHFGVFATADNQVTNEVYEVGRRMVLACDAHGIVEPEFKLDPRTGELVLMEVNFRSMMWHRLGAIMGVNLPWVQYCDALGQSTASVQQSGTPVRLVYFAHEAANLLLKVRYLRTFGRNCFGGGSRQWAVFSLKDPMPAFLAVIPFMKLVFIACRSKFRLE